MVDIFSFFFERTNNITAPFCLVILFVYGFISVFAINCYFFEGKPITYGFEMPYETFSGEIILFFVQSFAFYCFIYYRLSFPLLKKILRKMSFFQYFTVKSVWIMGLIGIIAFLTVRNMGEIQTGEIGGKFLGPLSAMRLIPIVLFFPSLCSIKGKMTSKQVLWIYLLFLEILSLSGNSREHLIYPIGTYIILFFLQIVKKRKIWLPLSLVQGFLCLLYCLLC